LLRLPTVAKVDSGSISGQGCSSEVVSLSRKVGVNVPLNLMVCVARSARMALSSATGEGGVVALEPIAFADFVGALRAQL